MSAIKANLVIYGLEYELIDHPRIRYFLKSMKMSRPLSVTHRPIMSIQTLHSFIAACSFIPYGKIFAAVFLIAYFVFLRISNMAPHSYGGFDPSRHLTPADVKISKHFMYVSIKWSKTNQFRNRVETITLPRLKSSIICPVRALKQAMILYNPAPHDPLFQMFSAGKWSVLIDSRIRKVLAKLNVKLGFPPNEYTFHTFRRSGATLAYNSNACNPSSNTVLGLQTVSGLIFRKTSPRVKKLLRLSLGLYKCFPTSTVPLRVLYIYTCEGIIYIYFISYLFRADVLQ